MSLVRVGSLLSNSTALAVGADQQETATPEDETGTPICHASMRLNSKLHLVSEHIDMVATKHYTLAEYEQMGSASDRFELIRGELREVAAAGKRLGAIGGRLMIRLGAAEQGRLGEFFTSDTGFVVARNPDTLLMPDVSFVRADRLRPDDTWDGFVPFAPDLAVEVESPSNQEGEILEKTALYLSGGTQLAWLIRPRYKTITVFRPGAPEQVLNEDDTLDAGDLIPNFRLELADLFRGIPASSAYRRSDPRAAP